jgi:hypothetical protein
VCEQREFTEPTARRCTVITPVCEGVNREVSMNSISIPVNHDLVRRIQMEFVEMPGLRLTNRQARRLWNLDEASCEQILTILVEQHFLLQMRDGSYLRS